jgi:hypothetical protein
MRANLILTALFCWTSVLTVAQNPNPFELLWRIDGKITASPTPTPPAEVTPLETPLVKRPQPTAVETTAIAAPDPVIPEELVVDLVDTATLPVQVDTSTIIHDTANTLAIVEEEELPPVEIKQPEPEPVPRVEAVTRDLPEAPTPLVHVLIFGLLFSLLAWVLSLNRDILRKVYRAALNENFSALLFREQRFATTQYLYYIIYFVFFITGGMFLYLIGREFGWSAWVFRSIWSCIGLVSVVYLLRHLTLNILGNTYPVTKEATHFSFSILLHNILLGIGLIPVTLFLAFGPESLDRPVAIAGIAFCGLVYLMRQFRGLVIGGSFLGSSPLHFFIYLCAVEILPLITLVKFFHH